LLSFHHFIISSGTGDGSSLATPPGLCDLRWASLTRDHAPACVDLSDDTEERQKTQTVWQIVTNAEPTAAASVFHLSSSIPVSITSGGRHAPQGR
jgi:hypothetical protein